MSRYRQTMAEALEQVREANQKPYVSMSSGGQYNVLDKDGKTAYSTKDKTLAYDYFKKNYDNLKEQDDKDHEISMARGELEAIADKATQLSAALQGKSDEGNPLEAWVQSKITKAKDYINSVSDYMMYKPEEVKEATYGWTLVSKAKDIAKKFANNLTKAVAEIEKLEKGLSKNSTVAAELRKYNESLEEKFTVQITKKDGTTMELGRYNTAAEAQRYVDMYGKGAKVKKEESDLEEASLKDIFTANQEGKKADEIAKKLGMSVSDIKKILGEEMGEVSEENLDEFTSDMIKRLKKSYSTMPKKLSTDQANALSRHLDRLDLTSLKQLAKEKIPFITTLARNKIYKKTGKFEQIEEQDGVEIAKIRADRDEKDKKEVASKEKEVESLKNQVAMLKTKLENEKNRAIKPEPNPETGEVPLTIGIANKLLKDKAEKEAKKKEVKEERRLYVEAIAGLQKKADKSGMPYSILKKVYDRGMAAWKGGHRPGASQHQWAFARVNSFVTKSSGTWGGADKDLAKQVKG